MVVVPALAEGQQGEPEIVAAVVAGVETAAAVPVRQRVDGHRGMEQHHGGNEEAPHQHLRPVGAQLRGRAFQQRAKTVQGGGQQHRHHGVVAVQPAQLRVARQVGDARPVRAETLAGQEPARMAPPEPALVRRMRIGRGIGVAMMVAVVRGPPQRSTLHAGGADQREHELQHARGAEGAVREVAVVEAGDGEHPHCVQRDRHGHRDRRHPDPEHGDARQVQADEGHHAQPVDAVRLPTVVAVGLGVEPAAQDGRGTADRHGRGGVAGRHHGGLGCVVHHYGAAAVLDA